jgi:hypothetical protein
LATAVAMMPPCEIQPIHEKQVRPLAKLEPAQQCEVWEEAVRCADGKVVTEKQVKALVAELIGRETLLTSWRFCRPRFPKKVLTY